MEKALVLYEKGDKFEKAYVETLAGEQVVVSKVLVENKYFEIMVFATDDHGRVMIYEPIDEYKILNPVIASHGFNDEVEKWSNETRKILEVKPDLFVCEA